ncbi:laminin subunit alpha [Bemisia tabaci]|uniref:laminin subunit alpha n=1 Tax=Bemisia tabaci TaxID=7038 RepID=UPI003B27BF77
MSVGKNSNRQTATVVVLDTTITPIANLATVILMVLLILIVKQKASNVLVSITMLESSVTSAGKDFTIFLNVFPVSVTQQEPKQIFVIQKLVIVLVRTVMVVETCDQCNNGYYDFPGCTCCSCDQKGTVAEICEKNLGKCLCAEGYEGDRCDAAQILSSKTYNDNQWHHVEAVRLGRDGVLKVDASEQGGAVSDRLYVGGYPGEHKLPDVSNTGFDGCVDNVQIMSISVDLSKNINALDVVPGCPEEQYEPTESELKDTYFELPFNPYLINYFLKLIKYEISPLLTKYINHSIIECEFPDCLKEIKVIPLWKDSDPTNPGNYRPLSIVSPISKIYEMSVVQQINKFLKINNLLCDNQYGFREKLKPVTFEDEEEIDYHLTPLSSLTTPPSSPTTPTVLPSQAPTPVGLCALPVSPPKDPNVTYGSGHQFGTTNGSRIEYPSFAPKLKSKFDVSLQFKTISQYGTILYAANELHTEYVAAYLVDGKVRFGFSGSAQPALLESSKTYNDGEWHELWLKQDGLDGELIIDSKSVTQGRAGGNKSTISLTDTVYIGGLDPKLHEQVLGNIMDSSTFFEGCLRNFRMHSRPIKNAKNPSQSFGVIPCSDRVERDTYFSVEGRYVKRANKFRVLNEFDVKLDFKSRSPSGFMLGVFSQNKEDFLSLQMKNGKIKFSVENVNGIISTSFEPPEPHFFCNSEWHSLPAVKAKNVVSLSVNKVFVEPGIGIGGSFRTDVKDPLYVGSHPDAQKLFEENRLETTETFIGCIRDRDIHSNGKQEEH